MGYYYRYARIENTQSRMGNEEEWAIKDGQVLLAPEIENQVWVSSFSS
jgi:hypothetical protein